MIPLKSSGDFAKMKEGGKRLSSIFQDLELFLKEGQTAALIDQFVHQKILQLGGKPSFLGYQGYQYATCISRNEEVVHGIPYEAKVFLPGDIASIDIGFFYEGVHLDAARTFGIGAVAPDVQKLIDVTEASFFEAIAFAKPGFRLGDMAHALQSYVESHGFSVVRDLYSHGVGYELHEEPLIPNFGKRGTGLRLKEGMSLAIEPMVNMGDFRVLTLPDKWTIISADRKWSAHYENTIFITQQGPEILTI